jgi:Phosphoesterase family
MTRGPTYNRRSVLRAGVGAASAAGLGAVVGLGTGVRPVRAASSLRGPGAMPYPSQPVGQYTGAFPFDHIVLVMQENHSFDNYLGILPVNGQPRAAHLPRCQRGDPGRLPRPVGHELRRAPRPGCPPNPLPGLVQGYQGQPGAADAGLHRPGGVLIA